MLGLACDGRDMICSHLHLRVGDDPLLSSVWSYRLDTGPVGPVLEIFKCLVVVRNFLGVLKVDALEQA